MVYRVVKWPLEAKKMSGIQTFCHKLAVFSFKFILIPVKMAKFLKMAVYIRNGHQAYFSEKFRVGYFGNVKMLTNFSR